MSCDDVADLLDRADLAPGERARRTAHLEACDDCRALTGAHALAAAALLAPDTGDDAPSPIVRERLLGAAALLHKQLAEPEAAPPRASDVRVRLRCTFCHGDLETPRAVYCADCLAPVHAGCFEDHGRCPAPGCGGQRVVEPRGPHAQRVRRRSRPLLALLVGAAIGAPVAAWSLVAPTAPVVAEHDDEPVVLPAPVVTHVAVVTTHVAPAPPPLPAFEPTAPAEPVRVLIVEDQPRWEYRYLKNMLLRDPGFVVQTLLLSADPEFEQEHGPGTTSLRRLPDAAELEGYDVIVLGDVAMAEERPPFLYPTAFQAIEAAARGGVGLLVIDGERSNIAWPVNPLGSILPVRFAPGGRPYVLDAGPFSPVRAAPSPEVLRLDDDAARDARVWEELPSFEAVVPVERTAHDAVVLLSARAPTGVAHPILAARRESRGVVAWLGVDELWRWRAGVGDRHMGRFYRQLLRAIVNASRAPAPIAGRIVRRDGSTLEADVVSIEERPAGWVAVTHDQQVVPLADVARISLTRADPSSARPALVLRDGSVLRGEVSSGGGLGFTGDALGDVSAPFDAVRALVLDTTPDGALDPSRWQSPPRDRIVRRDASLPLEGKLLLVDAAEVRLETEFGRMALPLDRVARVDWAARSTQPPPENDPRCPRARVSFVDGTSLVGARLLGLGDRYLKLRHPVLGERAVPRRLVATIEPE